MVSIEDLYRSYSILADAKEKASENFAAYQVIMNGIKSGASQKRLASQFIARFFRHFPTLAEESLDAIFDLCEDEDISVMKQAVHDLPQLCKDSVEYSQRAACILLQLLAAVSPSEQNVIYISLLTVLKANMKGTLEHIFELMTPLDETLCHQAVVFLHAKLKFLLADEKAKEIEEIVITNCKKVIKDVPDDDCLMLIQIMKNLSNMTTLIGRLYILDIISQRINFSLEVLPGDIERVKQVTIFMKEADGLFSKNVPSTNFVNFLCLHVVPVLGIKEMMDGGGKDLQMELLKLLANMVNFCGDVDDYENCISNVCDSLNNHVQMALFPNEQLPVDVDCLMQNMACVECLLFTLHQLCRHHPQFLTSFVKSVQLKNLRLRLHVVSRTGQMIIKHLQSNPKNKNQCTEAMVNNINSLIKDFYHNPPSFKSTVTLSFKEATSVNAPKPSQSGPKQRPYSPIVFETKAETKKPKLLQETKKLPQSRQSASSVPQQPVNHKAYKGTKTFTQKHRGRILKVATRGQTQGFNSFRLGSKNSTHINSAEGRLNQIPVMRGQRGQTQRTRTNISGVRGNRARGTRNNVSRLSSNSVPPLLRNFPPHRGSFGGLQRARGRGGYEQRRVVLKNEFPHGTTANSLMNW